jgi:hypothetical protein
MDVDGSAGSKGRLANDHKRTRYINFNSTETICGEGDITAFDHYEQISPRPYNIKPQTGINYTHNYKRAPEPLNSLDSHFQILEADNGKTLYLHGVRLG